MSYYVPGHIPANADGWLIRELFSISQSISSKHLFLFIEELHNAPSKPFTGMIVLADGTDWNPGTGAGFYGYYGGTWNKLG